MKSVTTIKQGLLLVTLLAITCVGFSSTLLMTNNWSNIYQSTPEGRQLVAKIPPKTVLLKIEKFQGHYLVGMLTFRGYYWIKAADVNAYQGSAFTTFLYHILKLKTTYSSNILDITVGFPALRIQNNLTILSVQYNRLFSHFVGERYAQSEMKDIANAWFNMSEENRHTCVVFYSSSAFPTDFNSRYVYQYCFIDGEIKLTNKDKMGARQ